MDLKSAQAELSAIQLKLSNIITEAKGASRDLTSAEIADVEAGSDRAFQLQAGIRGLKSAETMSAIAGTTAGEFTDFRTGETHRSNEVKGYITPASIKSMVTASLPGASKGLVAGGSTAIPVSLATSPLKLGTPTVGLGLLGLIPTKVRETPSYSYLRQTVRTNNADVVAPGALKPTSVFTVAKVDNSLAVVAHLSEYVDTYLLSDNSDLEMFLTGELTDGIFSKVTAIAVNAFATSAGIQTQAFAANVPDSIYAGASKVADLGYNPDVLLISRAAYDAMRLLKTTTGEYLGGNFFQNGATANTNIWGDLTPVIVAGLPANSALVLDSSKVGLSIDSTGITSKWDAFTKFDMNQTRALTEGRFAVDVFAPAAIAKVALV
ncbi:phage major capsid protein [Cryobacterium sp. Hz7]|uniref:phage major capsid protein n=1 Tax=Cryobacterium sp. Hz7 TaxID=1259166 RepID=UPI00106B3746|nr:phage major capsid protein [Cryobacterium sp. Hz7]TFB58710.1 phage major capsid protein [Cryobacterium sp. Hz7]